MTCSRVDTKRAVAALLAVMAILISSCQWPWSGGPSHTAGTGSSQPSDSVYSEDLILADTRAGRLDLATSLLYRAYALVGDPRLPAKYMGTGDADEAFFAVLGSVYDTLPASAQTELLPFAVRPDDPRSIFSTPWHNASSNTIRSADSGARLVASVTGCPAGWPTSVALGVRSDHFIAHECDRGGGSEAADMATVLSILEKQYFEMTLLPPNGMGVPIPDRMDIFGRASVFIVEPKVAIPRVDSSRVHRQVKDYCASAPMLSPLVNGRQRSGMILIDRDIVTGTSTKRCSLTETLIHEFFHVLQFAHNANIVHEGSGDINWYVEASATWAETYYGCTSTVHQDWFPDFQRVSTSKPVSLQAAVPTSHPYSSYIWPYFMQQESALSGRSCHDPGNLGFDGGSEIL